MRNLKARTTVAALVTAVIAFVGAGCGLHLSTGIEAKDTWTRTYKISAGGTFAVKETNGRIQIRAGTGDQIEVVATRVAKASTEEAAKAAVAKITINENVSPDRVELDSSGDSSFGFGTSRWVNYDVTVPKSLAVTVRTTNGEVTVDAVAGFVQIEAVNGEITASGLENGADVSAVNGRIELNVAKVAGSGIRCKTTNGEIVVTLPSDAKATVAARVANGDIDVQNLSLTKEEDTRRRLDATLNGGGPEIRLDTMNGAIRLVGR